MIDVRTGKPFTRRDACKGLAAIIAAGCAPSIVLAAGRSAMSIGGLRRGLGARVGMMGGKKLPHTPLNYLESDGSDYIVNNIQFNSAWAYDITCSGPITASMSSDYAFFGNRSSNISLFFGWWGDGNFRGQVGGVDRGVLGAKYDNYDVLRVILTKPNNYHWTLYKNGELVKDADATNIGATLDSAPLGVFRSFHYTYGSPLVCRSGERIHSIKVSNGSASLIDLTPVLKDGIGCFYNQVDGTYWMSQYGTLRYG